MLVIFISEDPSDSAFGGPTSPRGAGRDRLSRFVLFDLLCAFESDVADRLDDCVEFGEDFVGLDTQDMDVA